jgi:hypothetical protein
MKDALCDSCGQSLGLGQSRCGLALTGQRMVLNFDLCYRCQAGLLVALGEFLAHQPPKLVAA